MGFVNGVNLLPATGEFTYSTTAHRGQRVTELSMSGVDTYYDNFNGGTFPKTDYSYSIDQLQAAFPACTTVAVVCAWFGNSDDLAIANCQIYPATTYVNNGSIINPMTGLPWPVISPSAFQKWNGSTWTPDHWMVSGLTETSAGLIPISSSGSSFTYGGTPSDQSIVECIVDLKARGLRVVFYPFILMDDSAKSWRGRITYSPDVSAAAASAVADFLGTAATSQFTRDVTNKTVSYAGSPTDFTYRRMVLHYANLCVVAGGVDLFLIGSEFRGLETIRGPGWTLAGTTDGSGKAIWDYPFVAGMITLSDDVRSVFDMAGFTKDLTGLHNLISYAADWSDWMGWQHSGSNPSTGTNGQWPHLDQLWSHNNIDLVCFDNYLPLSDWTTGNGTLLPATGISNNLDIANWSAPAASDSAYDYGHAASDPVVSTADYGAVAGQAPASRLNYGLLSAAPAWPPAPAVMSNLGLSGPPTLNSKAYLKANIEGGEKFNWFYSDSNNLGRGNDPFGSDLQVSLPEGDRATQSRKQFFAGQQILGNKQLRWWWNNPHQAVYDAHDGFGEIPHGLNTEWVAQSKPIVFTEYGFPSCDKCTNQPNVFFDAKSTESATPFWSIWQPSEGGGILPKPNQNLSLLALQAIYEYWFVDGHNAVSGGGVKMIEPSFCSVWNWDARPFPAFPNLVNVWGDAGNWQTGNWLNGKGPFLTPPVPDQPGGVQMPFNFPALPGLSWSVHKRPSFSTRIASHVSGREVRLPFYATTLYEFELTIDGLDSNGSYPGLGANSLQSLMGLYIQCQGQSGTFLYTDPTDNSATNQAIATGDGSTTVFTFVRTLGGATEPASWVTSVANVYLNGVNQPSGWTLTTPNTLTFTTAPGNLVAITASFSYAFNCRFIDDQEDFENMMNGLWQVQSLKFRSVKP
ncbi:MAG TPA: glycoside hydrolase TIM-barrel-like domain-containing protein [Methylocella sp.]